MPLWPIEMPSETEIVPNSSGKPSAPRTPILAFLARRSRDRLQGVISFHDDATPICGLRQSSSPMPTARSMPRAAARSRPSVTMWLCGLRERPGSLGGVLTGQGYGVTCGHGFRPGGDPSPADVLPRRDLPLLRLLHGGLRRARLAGPARLHRTQ